ncbi:hypothetical protein OH491_00010 [Termitidicoccus mucosus]|uniref:Uncharacterized protein n=1 Tax=Termitidicoccus mucosus TaxID=1184151 RepID=A0A178IBK4_9BACT|nr:hypothetical protein AW736_23425 [Opitutaceae bacterium TSB47]
MSLTPEQKNAVASWVAAGDSLSDVQKKLSEQFKISMTYMDVRFLVDDLDLALKDPAPPPVPAAPAQPSPQAGPAARPDFPSRTPLDEDEAFDPAADDQQTRPTPMAGEFDDDEELAPEADAASSVRVEVDNVTLIPGALASGSVTFSDGVTGKWIVDNYGRPGFTQISKPDYRPTAADADAFMRQLSVALQKRGY